jgi:hypothetical protein
MSRNDTLTTDRIIFEQGRSLAKISGVGNDLWRGCYESEAPIHSILYA